MKDTAENIKLKLRNFSLGYGNERVWVGQASYKFDDEFAVFKDERGYRLDKSIVSINYCISNLESAKKCYDDFCKLWNNYQVSEKDYQNKDALYRQLSADYNMYGWSDEERVTKEQLRLWMNEARVNRNNALATKKAALNLCNQKRKELKLFLNKII